MNNHESTHPQRRSHQSCVTPAGCFCYGIHKPRYKVVNLRGKSPKSQYDSLGSLSDGTSVDNRDNFPQHNISVKEGDWVFEISNPLPFRGTTYITKSWADAKAVSPETIILPEPSEISMTEVLRKWHPDRDSANLHEKFASLPQPVLLALAAHSTDSADLTSIAKMACEISFDANGQPTGLLHKKERSGRHRPIITNHSLFEVVVNNPHLPDNYKNIMVLKPGIQGGSEIVGDYNNAESHVFEYFRRNSYIPWGHYAANMANDAIRYSIGQLSREDIRGLRHLYYQRTYTRMALELNLPAPPPRQQVSEIELEAMRRLIINRMNKKEYTPILSSTIWGWNYGFSCAGNGYRLHASHQMIHQQFAMLPDTVTAHYSNTSQINMLPGRLPSYGCGDLVTDFIKTYKEINHSNFFDDYLEAIRHNQRMDGHPDRPKSLIVFDNEEVILFVPKAQTSQWELQLMTSGEAGNILETNTKVRNSLDSAMLLAMQILTGLGAQMITTIEMPKRFNETDRSQRLLYSFLPKLPQSPGAFSEAQMRWINGHYPEDFAQACREKAGEGKIKG